MSKKKNSRCGKCTFLGKLMQLIQQKAKGLNKISKNPNENKTQLAALKPVGYNELPGLEADVKNILLKIKR